MRKVFCNILVVVMVLCMMFPVPVMAAGTTQSSNNKATVSASTTSKSTAPYTDVTVKKVGKDAYNAIKYLKTHQAFKELFTGKNFSPNKNITRRQFLMMLRNLYGNKVTITYNDLKSANKSITAKWACDKMVEVAKKLGVGMKWNGSKKVTLIRSAAAVYVKIFIDFDKRLKPKK